MGKVIVSGIVCWCAVGIASEQRAGDDAVNARILWILTQCNTQECGCEYHIAEQGRGSKIPRETTRMGRMVVCVATSWLSRTSVIVEMGNGMSKFCHIRLVLSRDFSLYSALYFTLYFILTSWHVSKKYTVKIQSKTSSIRSRKWGGFHSVFQRCIFESVKISRHSLYLRATDRNTE